MKLLENLSLTRTSYNVHLNFWDSIHVQQHVKAPLINSVYNIKGIIEDNLNGTTPILLNDNRIILRFVVCEKSTNYPPNHYDATYNSLIAQGN